VYKDKAVFALVYWRKTMLEVIEVRGGFFAPVLFNTVGKSTCRRKVEKFKFCLVLFFTPILLVLFSISHLYPADDPCGDANLIVNKIKNQFSNYLLKLPISTREKVLQAGYFEIKATEPGNSLAQRADIYLMVDNLPLHYETVDFGQQHELKPIKMLKGNGLFINFLFGAAGRLQCPYVIFGKADRYESIQIGGITQIEDLDHDGIDEIISLENIREFDFMQCDAPMALMPYLPNIYHIDQQLGQIINVSNKFPKYYTSLMPKYNKNYKDFWSSSKCKEEYERLIKKIESLANVSEEKEAQLENKNVPLDRVNKLEAYKEFIALYTNNHEYDKALDYMQRRLELEPNSAELYCDIGVNRFNKILENILSGSAIENMPSICEQALFKAIGLNPKLPEPYLFLKFLYINIYAQLFPEKEIRYIELANQYGYKFDETKKYYPGKETKYVELVNQYENTFEEVRKKWLEKRRGGEPVRAIGEIRPPKLIHRIEPVYPEIARQSKVEGTVILEVITDIRGKVKDAKVLRSIPLLDQAAIAAVRQWEYEPSIIEGIAREIMFTVTVQFTIPGIGQNQKGTLILNSRAALEEFLLKTFTKFKAYAETSPLPKKGEFETTKEYEARISNWRTSGGIYSELYKVTNLFPVKLGEYYADSELFSEASIDFAHFPELGNRLAEQFREATEIDPFSEIEAGYFPYGAAGPYILRGFSCPREKARKFRAEADKLRYDILFKLSYTPGYRPGSGIKYNFAFYLYGIKFYLPETGEILLETSHKKQ
jgi:TonB family protein